MKITKEQAIEVGRLMSLNEETYGGTYETSPIYEKFLYETFGENHAELHDEWQQCYDFEFDEDFWVFYVTGKKTKALKEWIKEGLQMLQELDLEEDLEEDLVESE
jgi:hypothetical protein